MHLGFKSFSLNTVVLSIAAIAIWLLSIFRSVVTLFFPCLKTILLAFFISIAFVPKIYSQPTLIAERQALFVRAYKSLGFILYMAANDPSFYKTLSEPERLMIQGIYSVAIETATLNWLIENKVQKFGKFPNYVYTYTVTKNRVMQFATNLEKPVGLQFSLDQNLFNLDPALPIRTAVTETGMDKDIFVNLQIINKPDSKLDLPEAASLLIHEFGHKLGEKKNQVAIDSLGAKLENYLRSMINTTEVNGKRISLLRYRNFPEYDQWIENILYGQYLGVNIPPQLHRIVSYDNQGVYVLVDDHGKITDLSDSITSMVRKNAIVQYVDQPDYHFIRHNVVMAAALTVSAVGAESFKISLNSNLLQFVVPFMKDGSYEPNAYGLFQRAFTNMDPQYGAFFSYEYTIDAKNYNIKKVRPLTRLFERPQHEVAFMGKKPKGNDLEIYFTISGDRKINLDHRIAVSELWPEIKITIGNSETIFKAAAYYEDSGEFKFVLKDFNQVKSAQVKIAGMQLRVKDQMLALPTTDMTARLLLPNEIVLAKGEQTKNPNPTPKLKSVQLWDGKNWTPLKQNSAMTEGMNLRFIFDTTEPLRELAIDQSYGVLTETTTSFLGKLIPSVGRVIEQYDRTVRIESQDMHQHIHDKQLYVDVNIDRNLGAELKLGVPILIDHSGLPDGGPLTGSGLIEHNTLSVENTRKLTGISFVTLSGQSDEFSFKSPLSFSKPPGVDFPNPELTNPRALKCIRLFVN